MPNSTPPEPLFDGSRRWRPGRGSKPAALTKARARLSSLAVTLEKFAGVTNQIGCAALLRATNAGCMLMGRSRSAWIQSVDLVGLDLEFARHRLRRLRSEPRVENL